MYMKKKDSLFLFFKISAALLITFSVIYAVFIYTKYLFIINTLDQDLKTQLEYKSKIITEDLEDTKENIIYLSKLTTDNLTKHSSDLKELAKHYLIFLKAHSNYQQLRFLDINGKEIARVDKKNNLSNIIENSLLQDKSHRHYFKNAINLKNGEIYISPLDLNMEHNKIEIPYRPVVRFIKPIFVNDEKKGYLVINHCYKSALKTISEIKLNGINTILLNKESYYLLSQDKEQEWGFMFNRPETRFMTQYPKVWQQIEQNIEDKISFGNKTGYFKLYDPVHIISPDRSKHSDRSWYIISFYDSKLPFLRLYDEFMSNLILLVPFFIFMLFISYLLTLFIIRLKNKEDDLIRQSNLSAMGEMIGMIAHQWRQPLASISAIILDIRIKNELLDNNDEELKESLNKVESYIQLLSKTINDFRNFYKSSTKKEFQTISDIVKNSIAIVSDIYKKSGFIDIVTEYKDNEKRIKINERELIQVILNLLSNARDVLIEKQVENPTITVSTTTTKSHVNIVVQDNGGGIPDEIMYKIFEPYFTTKDENGTGIGLYMVKTIVETHMNGTVTVKNTKEGACFTVSIPLEPLLS